MDLKKKKNKIFLHNKKILKYKNKDIKVFINLLLNDYSIYGKRVNIIFINPDDMQKINRKYRDIDKITDVISFSMNEGEHQEFSHDMFGDIYICEEYIGNDSNDIMLRIIHGILHLIGFDHTANNKEYKNFIKIENKYMNLFLEKSYDI